MMSRLMKWVGMLALCLASLLPAAEDKSAQKVYDGLMSDHDVYVGEGLVSLASFGGDWDKAKASGRERARGNMVESIRVRIVSKTTDTQSNGATGSKEDVKAESSSSADIELEGIQYKYLDAFPKEGQLTVLAFLSKEEYQRQSDKRLLGYRPLRALRLSASVGDLATLGTMEYEYNQFPQGSVVSTKQNNSSSAYQSPQGFGVDFYWNSIFFGASFSSATKPVTALEDNAVPNVYRQVNAPRTVTYARLGYEYTPWATRFQVAFPVQMEFAYLNWDPFFATGYGVAGGLTLRYWVTDRAAFDVGGRWHQGLSNADIATHDGKALMYRPAITATFDTTQIEITAGLLWNGF